MSNPPQFRPSPSNGLLTGRLGRVTRCAIAAAFALVSTFVHPPPALAAQQVTLMLNWLPGGAHVPFFYAHQAGFYKRAGIEIEIQSARGSAGAIAALSQGKAHFVIAEAAELFTEHANGLRVTGVMVYFSRSPNAVFTLKRPDISQLFDLAGKRIAAVRSSFSRFLFPALSAKGKIDLAKVHWQNLPPKSLLPALVRGKIDAVASSTMVAYQYRTAAQKKGKRLFILPLADAGVNPYSLILATSQEFIEKSSVLVRAFVRATAQGTAAALERPREALMAFLKVNPAALPARVGAEWRVAHSLIYSPQSSGPGFGKFSHSRIEEMRNILARLQRLQTIPSTIGVYSNAFMPSIRPLPRFPKTTPPNP